MRTKQEKAGRGRMNFADIVILALLIIASLALVYVMFFSDYNILNITNDNENKVGVICKLEISPVDDRLLLDDGTLPIVVGEKVYNIDSKYALGDILTIGERKTYVVPSTLTSESDGKAVYVEYPGKSAFLVEVDALAISSEGVYYIDGNALRIGESFSFATPYFTGICKCLSIEEDATNE